MDNGQNLLSEFLVLKPGDGLWQEMKQKRTKKDKRSTQNLKNITKDTGINKTSSAVSSTAMNTNKN